MKETSAAEIKAIVGKNLKKIREAKGLSQAALADLCGWGQSRVGNYERGSNSIDIPSAKELAKALGVDVADILIPGKEVDLISLINQQDVFGTDENKEDFINAIHSDLTSKLKNSGPLFSRKSPSSLTVKMIGSSMESDNPKKNIPDGSEVVILTEIDGKNLNGKAVYVKIDGVDEPIIKELQIDGPNTYLVPWNQRYEVIKVTGNYEVLGYAHKVTTVISD
ncbi:helix-turn-helix domain-containing protein [uncultured Tolumonas sp.]|uniref:helix-turn-helix domain-containing protein n=1 Tax=uncultured Tolumonas sp. TaxID=263765 RepID=UPI002A0A2CF7|nr:helix-turn-helix domain-containing protein [uncultured Tolumonas sp.]